jgi:S-adenosylmethionine hydrolase
LLGPAALMCGGVTRAVELTNPAYQLGPPGPTFAARDIFAPAAAHLALGVALTELGPEVDPHTLVPSLIPLSRVEEGVLVSEVLWVDRYGNCQLNVDPEDAEGFGDVVGLRVGDEPRRSARRVTAFGDLRTGQLGLLVDSYGLLTIVVAQGSAAQALGVEAGTTVRLEAPSS